MEVKSYVKGVTDVCAQIERILANPEFDENTCLWQIEEAVKTHRIRCEGLEGLWSKWS